MVLDGMGGAGSDGEFQEILRRLAIFDEGFVTGGPATIWPGRGR